MENPRTCLKRIRLANGDWSEEFSVDLDSKVIKLPVFATKEDYIKASIYATLEEVYEAKQHKPQWPKEQCLDFAFKELMSLQDLEFIETNLLDEAEALSAQLGAIASGYCIHPSSDGEPSIKALEEFCMKNLNMIIRYRNIMEHMNHE